MPFKSKAQARLMYAAKDNPKVAARVGVPMKTAKKLVKDSKHQKIKKLPVHVKKAKKR
jgi:hypothetical protein